MVKAVVCSSLGGVDALTLEDLPARRPGPGELRVAVHAAGLNFPDLLMAAGRYQLKHPLPFVPGLEAAGVVVEAGEGADAGRVGERVMFRAWQGCFAEEALVPAAEALPMPAGFGFAEGASFMVATSTATNALLQRGRLEPGETLLVHGAAGGVGLAAVEVGKLLGATVIGTASSPAKLAIAQSRGCDHGIDYTHERFADRVRALTGGAGADVILDTVGGEVFDQSVRCVAWGGRILVVGFAGGTIPELKMNQPLLKCFSIVGVRAIEHAERKPREGAAYRAWMLEQAGRGHLRPHVSHVLPLARFREALELLRTRQAIGRIVLELRAG
jgi:NADPH2:quinone reductase